MPELIPFLSLPVESTEYIISQGWRYSPDEQEIHGFTGHAGIDFSLSRNTPVFAAADGYAMASFFSFPVLGEEGRPKLYREKQVYMGLGHFVQIYHPDTGLYTSYGHLERIAEKIPYYKPQRLEGKLWPRMHKLKPTNPKFNTITTEVKQGQLIGYIGDSGLGWGYIDYPQRPDLKLYPSWDETHLHFEVFERYSSRGRKRYYDPYGIRGYAEDYPDSTKPGTLLGARGPVLWLTDRLNLPPLSVHA